ncbi:MAG TPA: class I SAM-dependent methyltransferase [Bacteroidia bacterium]|nr:class I SAM-dependent methyltransferase [Bacteroidia bacterium]
MSSERQEHNKNNPWWGEHIHRYEVAIQSVKPGSTILDIACGNGFGSFLLSQHTNEKVIGGDLSKDTIDYCKKTFSSTANLSFQQMDGTNIEIENNHFDMVVSFETIEHTTKYMEMLKEFHRITKKGGTVIISTPNKSVQSPDGIIKNPFHTQEFTYSELFELLKNIFGTISFYGQQYNRYSRKTIKNRLGFLIETLLYQKGIRKIPIPIQDKIMKSIIGKQMYPLPVDYCLTENTDEILKCKTFFVICKKDG